LCHSIIVERDDKDKEKLIYNTPSSDELALADFAKECGWEY